MVKPTVEPRVELNDVPDDFGYLLMEQLKEHILPQNILNLEKNTDASYFSYLERIMNEARTKSKEYVEGYSALIYLENAAEMLNLQSYNQTCLKFVYSRIGRIFKIKKNVSCK